MRASVSAQEALVLICARNDLFCLVGGGGVSGVCQVCVCSANSLSSSKSVTQHDEIKHPVPSSNFRGKTVGPICQVFSWTDVPRMRLQLKILFGIKALPISKKTRKTCWGRGGGGVDATPTRGLNI